MCHIAAEMGQTTSRRCKCNSWLASVSTQRRQTTMREWIFFVGGRERKKHIKQSEYKKVRRPPEKQRKKHPIEPAEKLHNRKFSFWSLHAMHSGEPVGVLNLCTIYIIFLIHFNAILDRARRLQPARGGRESESDMLWVEQFFLLHNFTSHISCFFLHKHTQPRSSARRRRRKKTQFFSPHSA